MEPAGGSASTEFSNHEGRLLTDIDLFVDYLVRQWSDAPEPLHDALAPAPHGIVDATALPAGCVYRPWHWYEISRHRCWKTWKGGSPATCSLRLPVPSRDKMWWCNGLREAADHYSWWSSAATGNFSSLSARLLHAMSTGNVHAAAQLCHLIFDWGGVGRTAANSSRQWVRAEQAAGSLVASLQRGVQALLPSSPVAAVQVAFGGSLPMNSATTKLYAAADPSGCGLIFDGRVGAALCLLVREHLRHCGTTVVPPDLEFFWGPAQNNLKSRNPSQAPYRFRNINTVSDVVRAQASRRANVLADAFNRRTGVGARTFETALFMIGYCV
jgi:hypothetical protein